MNFIGLYHFEKCEPEDVVYQLDYNPEGIAHKDEYVRMFRDCGWEYMQDYVGYSYFRKSVTDMNGNEEIFCDDTSRFDMMKRVFKGRMLPLLSVFFLIILPNVYLQSRFHTLVNHILTGFFVVMFVVYLCLFIWIGIQFWKYYKTLR